MQCAIIIGSGVLEALQPASTLAMSNRERCKWIGDLMEELDVDDNVEHDCLDYSSDDKGERAKASMEVEH